MSLVYLNRQQWGARTDIPRLGYNVPKDKRSHVIIHHTVVIDNDSTPNLWESLAEVRKKMQQLQTIRPDLGLDVPYNFVGFMMSNGDVVMCEGRGADLTGAHTHGHNTSGIGIAFQGNFELSTSVLPYIPESNEFMAGLKAEMPRLGTVRPPRAEVFGHRDFTQTACCGRFLYNQLPKMTIKLPPPAEEDEAMLVRVKGTNAVYATDGSSLNHIPGGKYAIAVYGANWPSKVVEIPNDPNNPLHPQGGLTVNYPKGHPPA